MLQASDILKSKLHESIEMSEEEHSVSHLQDFSTQWQAMEKRLGRVELQKFVLLITKLSNLQEKRVVKRDAFQAVDAFLKKQEVTDGLRHYALHTLPAMYNSYLQLTESSLRYAL